MLISFQTRYLCFPGNPGIYENWVKRISVIILVTQEHKCIPGKYLPLLGIRKKSFYLLRIIFILYQTINTVQQREFDTFNNCVYYFVWVW